MSEGTAHQVATASEEWKRRLGLPRLPIEVVLAPRPSLVARDVTGVVRAGGLDIHIAPKFLVHSEDEPDPDWRRALWQILSIVEKRGTYLDLTSARDIDRSGFPDLIADIFLDAIRRGSARGLPRSYAEYPSVEPVLRGSLDLGQIGALLTRPWELHCRVDELSEDTAASRLLAWAAAELATLVVSARRSTELRVVANSFSSVLRRPTLPEALRIQLGPQFQLLQRAVDIAVLLLQGHGYEHASGAEELHGFLWKSDDVYERFVLRLCQIASQRLGLYAEKRELVMGTARGSYPNLRTIPDVLVKRRSGATVAVVDAKYKIFGAAPKSSDAYQVYAASHVTGARRVALTYPATGSTPARRWSVPSQLGGPDVELYALPIDLLTLAERSGMVRLVSTVEEWLRSVLSAEAA